MVLAAVAAFQIKIAPRHLGAHEASVTENLAGDYATEANRGNHEVINKLSQGCRQFFGNDHAGRSKCLNSRRDFTPIAIRPNVTSWESTAAAASIPEVASALPSALFDDSVQPVVPLTPFLVSKDGTALVAGWCICEIKTFGRLSSEQLYSSGAILVQKIFEKFDRTSPSTRTIIGGNRVVTFSVGPTTKDKLSRARFPREFVTLQTPTGSWEIAYEPGQASRRQVELAIRAISPSKD